MFKGREVGAILQNVALMDSFAFGVLMVGVEV